MSSAANPRADNPQQGGHEAVGAVTSDSLAAESIRQDGGFAENNAAIQSVKGSNSTLNNTDTSGASVLRSAPDGATREKQDARSLGSDEKGVSGLKYPDGNQPDFDGKHSLEGYVGGPSNPQSANAGSSYSGATGDSFADGATGSSATKTAGVSSGSGYTGQGVGRTDEGVSSGKGASSDGSVNVDDAPNYAATVSGAIQPEGFGKPKGDNLTEGGIPETKTFTGNVGGVHDPGRLAEKNFEKINADTVSGIGGRSGTTDSGAFGALDSERA